MLEGRHLRVVLGAVGLSLLCGCGAAYYGSAIAFIATQEDRDTVDTSFPDAVPTDAQAPAQATLLFSTNQITVDRNGTQVTDFQVTGVVFPPTYGESFGNRDADRSLLAGDQLVIRLNGDNSRLLSFDTADTANIGSQVAANIEAEVRGLTPSIAGIPTEVYSLFSASFDDTTGAYRFLSGVPGEGSEVVWEALPRPGTSDAVPTQASATTSSRLGLGVSNGATEWTGAQSLRLTVLNRGTDTIPEGTAIELYLSRDKVLDPATDVHFDKILTDQPVLVGEARRFTRQNGAMLLPSTIIRQDLLPGRYFLLWEVAESGGEEIVSNQLFVSPLPVEITRPVDDPDTSATEVANALDFMISRTSSEISVVTGNDFVSQVTLTNLGAAVPADVTIPLDVILSSDDRLNEPAGFLDPNNVLAGVRINPTNPVQAVTVRVDNGGGAPAAANLIGNNLTVTYDGNAAGASIATVQSLVDALNSAGAGGVVRAFTDGNGSPLNDSLNALLTAAGGTEVVTQDLLLTTQNLTFSAAPGQQASRSFNVAAPVQQAALQANVLPLKLQVLFRIRPPDTPGEDPENDANNVRLGGNYLRIYDRARAAFDQVTGTILPTVNGDDFARLDAVTLRPVNTGSIRQGQQRVFSFELPSTGLVLDESQLLVILRAPNFDAHIDLLNASGQFLSGSDDSAQGLSPIVYRGVQASTNSRIFYLVVAPARFDESDLAGGGETFELTISVNPRSPGDLGPVVATDAGNLVSNVEQRQDPTAAYLENNVLIPFSLANSRAEIMFVLPERARVRFRSRPVFQVGVQTVITAFVEGGVPAPVDQQAVLDATLDRIVYRPSGGDVLTFHELEKGVYTVAFDGLDNQPDTQDLRLEIEAEFIPD